MKLSRQARARLAWITSFFKVSWRFEDYPIDYIDQGECSSDLPKRLQKKRWRADLLGAHYLLSLGDDHRSALDDAKRKYTDFVASGQKMTRPGSKPKITFAPGERVSRFPELRDNFIKEVFQLEWALVTDESSLWDFHSDPDNRNMHLKIAEVYGVDVSHITSANLADILNAIMDEIGIFPEDEITKIVRLGRDARARYNMGLPEEPWNPY